MATSTLGSGTLVLAGTTSGTTTVTATAVAGTTTLTLPAATDTLVGKATTDTLTNKTLTGAAMNGTLGATTPSTVAATTISASSTATFAAGAVGTPSITTSGDTNTGIFFPAADTIAFAEGGVEAARFDSSGNFGLGVTPVSQNGKVFHIDGGAGAADIRLTNNATGSAINNGALFTLSGSNVYLWNLENDILSFGTNNLERARIDSSGRLGIGVTNPSVGLVVAYGTDGIIGNYYSSAGANSRISFSNNALLNNNVSIGSASDALVMYTANAERARIGSGGGISIFSATTANDTIDSCNNQAAGTTYSTFIGRHSATTISTGTVSCRIYTNGNIINTNNSYGQISDIKLKENIVDATPKLEKLSQVRVVNFNFIGDQQKQLGVVAQELEQVFPGMIDESPDKDAEGNDLGTTTKSVKYSVFVPMLIKALQEQQALITQLTARITALESA